MRSFKWAMVTMLLLVVGCHAVGRLPSGEGTPKDGTEVGGFNPSVVQMNDISLLPLATIDPPAAITADLPLFTGSVRQGFPFKGVDVGYVEGGIDSTGTLGELATNLHLTGNPSEAPGIHASFVSALDDNKFVYALWNGAVPTEDQIYLLEGQGTQWIATPMCKSADQWVWSNASSGAGSPVVICAATEGSAGTLTVAVYDAHGELLRATGLLSGGLEIPDISGPSPPTLVLFRRLHWYRDHHEPPVFERVAITWNGTTYKVSRVERREDWAYHVGRFLALLQQGQFALAEREMAVQPPQGLQNELAENAPALLSSDPITWLQVWNTRGTTVFLNQGNASTVTPSIWLRIRVGTDGRILDFSQQDTPPNRGAESTP